MSRFYKHDDVNSRAAAAAAAAANAPCPCSGGVRHCHQMVQTKRKWNMASCHVAATGRDSRRRPPPLESDSQVLIGVVLAPAVGGGAEEGQLLATGSLQLQDPAAQVQAALGGGETSGLILIQVLIIILKFKAECRSFVGTCLSYITTSFRANLLNEHSGSFLILHSTHSN